MIGQLSIYFLTKQADELFSQGDIEKILTGIEEDGMKIIDNQGRYKISGMLNSMGEISYELLKKKYNLPDHYFFLLTFMSYSAWQLDIAIHNSLSSSEIQKRILLEIKSVKKQFKKRDYKKMASDEFMGVAFLLCLKIKNTLYGKHLVSINKMELTGDENGTKIKVEYEIDKNNPIEYTR